MRSDLLALSLCVLALSACGGMDPGTDAGTDGGAAGAGTDAGKLGDAGTLVGTFQLQHTGSELGDSASLYGKVFDGPTPKAILWTVALTEGDCRVEVPRAPFCATPCGGNAVCVADDTCQPYPTSNAVGTVHVTGALSSAGSAGFDMSPIVNGYQPSAATTLQVPPFTDGAAVTLAASGSTAVPAFSLTAPGVAPIALVGTTFNLVSGTPLELQWAPGAAATGARIEVSMDISHHGGQRGELLCETADDGALTIPAALVTKLIDLGVAGFPAMVVRRVVRGSTVIAAGRVDLEIFSSVEKGLVIPGLISCTDSAECPMGQACGDDLRCQ